MEVDRRSPQGTSDRPEGVFLAPAMVGDATSLTAGESRTRTRSDDEESTHVAHIADLDGDQGEELTKADITDPGCLRKTGDGSQDELGSGRQR
jgi:hypothetical protein